MIVRLRTLLHSFRRVGYGFARSGGLKNNFPLRVEVAIGGKIKDHQYCKLIDDDVESLDVPSALQILLSSYFHNVTLDKETFGKMFDLLEN